MWLKLWQRSKFPREWKQLPGSNTSSRAELPDLREEKV
jgi:hypothetical protein